MDTLTRTVTTFDPHAMPATLRTVQDFHAFARERGLSSWRGAMRAYARMEGGAYCVLCNGALLTLTVLSDGRIRQTTYKPHAWRFAPAAGVHID